MDAVVLAHGRFPHEAKTAVGVLRYAPADAVAVLDRETAGGRVGDYGLDLPDVPIVAEVAEAPPFDALVIGIAPIGGGFDESWRPDVRGALERGADVYSGLHYFLEDDQEFSELARKHGGSIHDLRRPSPDLSVAAGRVREIDAEVILTVGTDCSTGKMTTTMELAAAASERGIDAAVIPTGQTGILIENWGIPVDSTVSDYAAGAVERMIFDRSDHDYLFVEGQGSITHPAYSGVTCSILHGAMPDRLVLCHRAGRRSHHGYESFPLAAPDQYVDLYEGLAEPVHSTTVAGGSLNTRGLDEGAARDAIGRFARSIDVPAVDPLRDGVTDLLEAVL